MVFANTFLSFSLGAALASFQAKFALGFSSNSFFHEVKRKMFNRNWVLVWLMAYTRFHRVPPPCCLPPFPSLVRVTALPQRGQFFVFSYAVTELRLLRRLYATKGFRLYSWLPSPLCNKRQQAAGGTNCVTLQRWRRRRRLLRLRFA